MQFICQHLTSSITYIEGQGTDKDQSSSPCVIMLPCGGGFPKNTIGDALESQHNINTIRYNFQGQSIDNKDILNEITTTIRTQPKRQFILHGWSLGGGWALKIAQQCSNCTNLIGCVVYAAAAKPSQDFSAIRCKVIFYHNQYDQICPIQLSQRNHQLIKHSELVVSTKRLGRYSNHHQCDEFHHQCVAKIVSLFKTEAIREGGKGKVSKIKPNNTTSMTCSSTASDSLSFFTYRMSWRSCQQLIQTNTTLTTHFSSTLIDYTTNGLKLIDCSSIRLGWKNTSSTNNIASGVYGIRLKSNTLNKWYPGLACVALEKVKGWDRGCEVIVFDNEKSKGKRNKYSSMLVDMEEKFNSNDIEICFVCKVNEFSSIAHNAWLHDHIQRCLLNVHKWSRDVGGTSSKL